VSAFLSDKFAAAKFEPRTERYPVPPLADFFADGAEPVLVIRGLTANELHKANEAGTRQNAVEAVVKAITTQKDQIDTIRKALGLTSDTPGEIAKRMEMLLHGCVEPVLTHADVAKIAEVCPIEFYEVTNKIGLLTGQGSSRVKSQPSSQTIAPQ